MNTVDYILAGALLVMMAIGITFSASMPALDKWNKHYFITLFSLLFFCAVTCFLALIFYDDPTKATTERVIYFFESLFMVVPIFMPTIFILHCSREKVKRNLLFYAMIALMGVYFAFLIVAQFTDVFYYVTPDNRFFYGPLYKLSLVPLVLIMLLNIAGVMKRRKKLSKLLLSTTAKGVSFRIFGKNRANIGKIGLSDGGSAVRKPDFFISDRKNTQKLWCTFCVSLLCKELQKNTGWVDLNL